MTSECQGVIGRSLIDGDRLTVSINLAHLLVRASTSSDIWCEVEAMCLSTALDALAVAVMLSTKALHTAQKDAVVVRWFAG